MATYTAKPKTIRPSNAALVADKKLRESYLRTALMHHIAASIRKLRLRPGKKMTQLQLGRLSGGKLANSISRLEDPHYGRYSVRTLIDIANAFDVALVINFVSWDEFLLTKHEEDLCAEASASQNTDDL
jgi:hypothetical protein